MERATALINSPPRVIQGITLKFPAKLWRIINKCISGALSWNSSGTAIVIRRELFEDEFLSANGHFKTTNFTSFVRQLNIYGFRKLVTRARWYERDNVFEYYHPCFQRGHPELLPGVVRNTKKLGTQSRTNPSEECYNAVSSSRANKIIFVDKLGRKQYPNVAEQPPRNNETCHPLLSCKYDSTIRAARQIGGLQPSPSDIQTISPTRLHDQVRGVVPGMDFNDEDKDDSKHFLNSGFIKTDVDIIKQENDIIQPEIKSDFSISSPSQLPTRQPLVCDVLPASVANNSHWNSMMKSPDLTVLSQSSAESETAKSMELMFSSIIPQDEHEEDCLTNTLKHSPDCLSNTETNGDTSTNLQCPSTVCNLSLPVESGDLDSYPFPLGDTLLEYNDDDMGVFTPAYFNPYTGMVTLLLPNPAGDN